MAKIKFIIGSILIWSVGLSAVAGINYTDVNKPIIVHRKQPVFSIIIKANPTTGYQWFLAGYNKTLLVPLKQRYVPSKKGLIGGGGYDEWTFRMQAKGFVAPQLASIRFIYMRPWILKDQTIKVFKILTINE